MIVAADEGAALGNGRSGDSSGSWREGGLRSTA